MVAYSFKERFCQPIIDGTKRQTIRARGARRHARVGEQLQLYFGMRTKHCRKIIPDRPCLAVLAVRLVWEPHGVEIFLEGDWLSLKQRMDFIVADGFERYQDMREFWAVEHPGVIDFSGVCIKW